MITLEEIIKCNTLADFKKLKKKAQKKLDERNSVYKAQVTDYIKRTL